MMVRRLLQFLLIAGFLQTNISYAQKVKFIFGTHKCAIQDVKKFNGDRIDDFTRTDERYLITRSFMTDSYEEYVTLFLPGECHVTKETFYKWKSSFGYSMPSLKTAYNLMIDGERMCIIQYEIEYNGNRFMGSSTQKKVGDEWFFMRAEKAVELKEITFFFSLVKDGFISEAQTGPVLKTSSYHAKDVVEGTVISGDVLINAYLDKYDQRKPLHDLLNLVFLDRIIHLNDEVVYQNRNVAIKKLISDSDALPGEVEYLNNLIDANLFGEAVARLSVLKQMSESDILLEIGEQIKNAKN